MDVWTYSSKQMGVIYRAFKEGNITATKDDVSELYDMVGSVYTASHDRMEDIQRIARKVKNAIEAIFASDYSKAQESMDEIHMILAEAC